MRFPGIVVCILALFGASAFHQAQAATPADTAAANSARPAPKNTMVAASKAKKAEPKPAQSFITFYWSKGAEGSPLFAVFREKLLLSVDGKDAGKLIQGEYISVPVEPGHHTYGYERSAISSEGETKREVDVPQGQNVYFEVIEKDAAGFAHLISLQQTAADVAQAEVAKLRLPLLQQTAPVAAGVPGAPGIPGAPAGIPGVSASAPQAGGKPGKKGAAPPPVLQSYIVFYWPKRTSGTMSFLDSLKEHFGVAIDDQPAGSFTEGQYISIPVQPGPHTYSYGRASQVSFNEKKHSVDVAPGQSLYFEVAEQDQGMVTVVYPQQVSAEQGQPALAGLQPPGRDD